MRLRISFGCEGTVIDVARAINQHSERKVRDMDKEIGTEASVPSVKAAQHARKEEAGENEAAVESWGWSNNTEVVADDSSHS